VASNNKHSAEGIAMNEDFRRQIIREFPELAAGYHVAQMAVVKAVPDSPIAGGINDNFRPRYAVDVEMINSRGEETGIQLDGVPVELPAGGGHERGFFALPVPGTMVTIEWLGGSPERPCVRGILGERQALPEIDQGAMTWQQANHQRQIIDRSGNWSRETDQKITDSADRIEQIARLLNTTVGHESRRVFGHSREDIDGEKRTEATAIHLLAETVANILAAGSVNTLAGENITHNAGGEIRQQATEAISQKTSGEHSVEANSSSHSVVGDHVVTAEKIYIGNNATNLLAIISDTLAQVSTVLTAITTMTVTCTAPGSSSSVPVNAAAFASAKAEIDSLKTSLDAFKK